MLLNSWVMHWGVGDIGPPLAHPVHSGSFCILKSPTRRSPVRLLTSMFCKSRSSSYWVWKWQTPCKFECTCNSSFKNGVFETGPRSHATKPLKKIIWSYGSWERRRVRIWSIISRSPPLFPHTKRRFLILSLVRYWWLTVFRSTDIFQQWTRT